MRVLGCDPSMTAFGLARGEAGKAGLIASTVTTRTIRAENLHELARELKQEFADFKPDLVAYEGARRDIAVYGKKGLLPGMTGFVTPNANQLVLLEIQGLIIGISVFYGAALIEAQPRTWRKQVLGNGNLDRAAAKAAAKAYCRMLGIKAGSVDAAEAVCIAVFGAGLSRFNLNG